jgi:PAS domain S-box-containing protein
MTRILIVDDNEEDRYMLRVLLQGHGYEVAVASNGAEALATAAQDPPDIIIADVLMPVMDGFSLCRQWRRDDRLQAIPFLFYSATYTDPRDQAFALSLGADRFIIKPTEPDVFIGILLEVIAEHEAGRLVVHREMVKEETVYLREYNAALIRKLEDKLVELEEANHDLQRDIAGRKQAEEALRHSEERYRSLVENLNDAVFMLDTQGRLTYISSAIEPIFGYSVEQVTDQPFSRFIYPDDLPRLQASFVRTLAGQLEPSEFRVFDRQRDVRWVRTSSRPQFDHEQLVGLTGIVTDITERKQTEEALQQSEARYRDLYDNAPDGYCVMDIDGLIRDMNATQLNWLGYSRQEVIGRMQLKDLLMPEGRRQVAQLLNRCKREGHVENVEHTLVCRDGRRLPVRLNMRAIYDPVGQCTGYRATTRDISKEKELEAQLLQAQKLESLGTLVGGIAHDFNNMLTSILGFTELLLEEVAPESHIHDDLQRIRVLSVRAADMIRQLMIFSRHDISQKNSLRLHPFLEELTKLLERVIPENIKVELSLAAADLMVEADPAQLQQVVMNLVVNARDAMPEGGRLLIGTARVERNEAFWQAHPDLSPGEYALLSVSDSGVGIPVEICPYIFDPFFTTKSVGKGTGLGLPVVYGIVKNHAGAIEVESQVGRGTTMKIYLPLSEQPVVEVAPPAADLLTGTETILLVEDEPLVLDFGRTALEYFGYRVLTAQDGVEALEVFQAHQDEIALVILDVVMPRMGGRETARELKRRNPTLAVLLATGYDSLGEPGEELPEKVAYEFLTKPYRIRELARVVRAALDQRSPNNQPR